MSLKLLKDKIKILVIQDDHNAALSMKKCFMNHPNFNITHFDYASKIFTCKDKFDLAITDLKLPFNNKKRLLEFQNKRYFDTLKNLSRRHIIYTASSIDGDFSNYHPWMWLNNCFMVLGINNVGEKRFKMCNPTYELIAKLILQRDFGLKAIFDDPNEAGNTFEELVLLNLNSLDWMWVDVHAQKQTFFGKIDFWVEKKNYIDPFWDSFNFRILVECKNYSKTKIGLEMLRQLAYAVEHCKNCNLGFYFAFGEFKRSPQIVELFKGYNIIPIDLDRIKLLLRTFTAEEKTKLFKQWLEEVELNPTSISLKGW